MSSSLPLSRRAATNSGELSRRAPASENTAQILPAPHCRCSESALNGGGKTAGIGSQLRLSRAVAAHAEERGRNSERGHPKQGGEGGLRGTLPSTRVWVSE